MRLSLVQDESESRISQSDERTFAVLTTFEVHKGYQSQSTLPLLFHSPEKEIRYEISLDFI